jgi:hypothetical protein
VVVANGLYSYLQVVLVSKELPGAGVLEKYWGGMWASGTVAVIGVVCASVILEMETWGGIAGLTILAAKNWKFGRDQWLQMRGMRSEGISVGKGWENAKRYEI